MMRPGPCKGGIVGWSTSFGQPTMPHLYSIVAGVEKRNEETICLPRTGHFGSFVSTGLRQIPQKFTKIESSPFILQ